MSTQIQKQHDELEAAQKKAAKPAATNAAPVKKAAPKKAASPAKKAAPKKATNKRK